MLQVLKNSFGTSNDVEQYKTSYTIFNIRIREGASVTDYVLYIIEYYEYVIKTWFKAYIDRLSYGVCMYMIKLISIIKLY